MSALDRLLGELGAELAERAADTAPDPQRAAHWLELAGLLRGLGELEPELGDGHQLFGTAVLEVTDYNGQMAYHRVAIARGVFFEADLDDHARRIRVRFEL